MYTASYRPRWLQKLKRTFHWIAIPHIAVLLVTLQAGGFLLVQSNPFWVEKLALFPHKVFEGEFWRLITFLSLPLSYQFLWQLLILWFLYYIVNSMETIWGSFQTTFYVLCSVLTMIAFSMLTGFPIFETQHFETTLFLAAAGLFPEEVIYLFFVLPVKMKWLAWITLAYLAYLLLTSFWIERFYLFSVYFNYLIFFAPLHYQTIKSWIRKKRFQQKMK